MSVNTSESHEGRDFSKPPFQEVHGTKRDRWKYPTDMTTAPLSLLLSPGVFREAGQWGPVRGEGCLAGEESSQLKHRDKHQKDSSIPP